MKRLLLSAIKAAMRQAAAPLHILAFVAAVSACSSIDCPVQNSVYSVYHVYGADGQPDTLSTDTLTVKTLRRNGTDTILLNRSVDTKTFELPMSYNNPTDTLIFVQCDTAGLRAPITDTVYVSKTDRPQFESVDCNIAFFHDITSVRWTRKGIDSVGINKTSVTYDASTEHFHIFFKARH